MIVGVRRLVLVLILVWTVAWLVVDLLWGGLVASGFNVGGLQEALSAGLYLAPAVVILPLWVLLVGRRSVRRLPGAGGH
jgi:hypothetical protein